MKIEQIYTGCLAEAAYYISSEGEAIIIDPLREIKPYLQKLERNKDSLKYILETHFHADFVSGHIDLASATGATIVFGPGAQTNFNSHIAKDGEFISVGKIKIEVLHTPGHTPESVCYLLYDEQGNKQALFTGDTLFIGDVGRPDLAIKGTVTEADLAGMLYDSLQAKIIPLPDSIILYPGHGAGSACGKNISKETTDTLGNQKQTNYALKAPNKESFIKQVLDGLQPAPAYFSVNAQMNKQGYANVDEVIKQGTKAFNAVDFEVIQGQTHALILDTRPPDVFKKGFIPGSVNIGLNGQFAPWAGTLLTDTKQPILLVTEVSKEEESVIRLSRVGVDSVIGYLEGGYETWAASGKATDTIDSVSPKEMQKLLYTNTNIIDVRKASEYQDAHLEDSQNLALDNINDWTDSLDKNQTYYIHCAGGYRSVIAESILKSRGFQHIIDIEGGYSALNKELHLSKKGWLKSLFPFIKN